MWNTGDQVLKRFLGRDKSVTWVVPITIVEDTPDRLTYYVASGTPILRPVHIGGAPIERRLSHREFRDLPWEIGHGIWHTHSVLWTSTPGATSDIGMFFTEDFSEFRGWYVNLQAAFQRTPVGFDTTDHLLDIRVDANGTWTWKDQEEFAEALEYGRCTPEEAAAIRAEGERMIGKIERAEWPFQPIWDNWRPDAGWSIPSIPPNWDARGHA